MGQGMGLSVHQDPAVAAQVDHPQFPAVQEIRGPERLPAFQFQGPGRGHRPAEHHPVHVAVDQVQLAGDEDPLHQEMPAQGGRVVALHILRMMGVAGFHLH